MGVFSKCHIDSFSQSNQWGDVALKSLQNTNIPDLDLFVREAVQNSSDASLGVDSNVVGIEFNCRQFNCAALREHMLGIENALEERFPETHATFLEVRDTNTVGLAGPFDYDEVNTWGDHGNYFKLVIDWGKKQEQKGAGGNWGFGKSVYYRVGESGLVFYYSRIDSDSPFGYEDRLIATMVEDCGIEDRSILRKVADRPTGRAWWGVPGDKEDKVLPITDSRAIERFLSLFGLCLFGEKERGTSVIIPYINEARLLEQVIPHDSVSADELARCVWKDSVPEYLIHSIQKWYSPRLGNRNLRGLPGASKSISAKVNGEGLRARDMPRFFQLVQELYTKALHVCAKDEKWESSLFPGIKTKEISLRRESLDRTFVGAAAFVKITNSELNGGQACLSPYTLTRNFRNDTEVNEPIVMFARESGMVIDYSIKAEWSKNVPPPPKQEGALDEEYIVAFFVPDTGNRFLPTAEGAKNEGFDETYVDLGGYLRECEASDHASWRDIGSCTIVQKIQGWVSKGLVEEIKPAESRSQEISTSRLSNRIGKALLPPLDYASGKKASGKGAKGSGSGGKKRTFAVGDPSFALGSISIPISLYFSVAGKIKVAVEALSETGSDSLSAWEKDVPTPFPFEILSAKAFLEKKDGSALSVACEASAPEASSGPLSVELGDRSGRTGGYSSLLVGVEVGGQTVSGSIVLRSADRTIECQLKAISVGMKE